MRLLVFLITLLVVAPPGYGQRSRSWASGLFVEASGTSVARTMRQEDRRFPGSGTGVSGRVGYGPVSFLAIYAGAGRAALRESNEQRTRQVEFDGGLVASLPLPIPRVVPFATLAVTRSQTHAEARDMSNGAPVPVTTYGKGLATGIGVWVRVAGPLAVSFGAERTSGTITEMEVGDSRSEVPKTTTAGHRLRIGLALAPRR